MRNSSKVIFPLLWASLTLSAAPSLAQGNRDPVREMRLRAELLYQQERLNAFIEDSYKFYEASGELVSFRVVTGMSEQDIGRLEERSKDLDDEAGHLISYIRYVAPQVRGKTEGLWVILDPLDEGSSLDQRLTLILALVNGLQPKIQHLIEVLTGEAEPAITVEDLRVEASLPYLIVGGLEELRSLTRELRRAL